MELEIQDLYLRTKFKKGLLVDVKIHVEDSAEVYVSYFSSFCVAGWFFGDIGRSGSAGQ